MATPQWESFAGVTVLVLGFLVLLARASQATLTGPESGSPSDDGSTSLDSVAASDAAGERRADSTGELDSDATDERDLDATGEPRTDTTDQLNSDATDESQPGATGESRSTAEAAHFTPVELLLNVALSQGAFGAVLVGAAWLADIPPAALGVGSVTFPLLGVGVALGVALFGANELGQRVADGLGVDYADGLRELLTPDDARGWAVLLFLVLPVIAGFEELLFRGALVGALAAGFGVSPWLLAAGSTVAFAVGHGAQGPGGIVVTGLLGGVLAAAFVLTGSLLVVVVAHYLVNALEFVVHARGD